MKQNVYSSFNVIEPIGVENTPMYAKLQRIHEEIHHCIVHLQFLLSNQTDKREESTDKLTQLFNSLAEAVFTKGSSSTLLPSPPSLLEKDLLD